MAVSFRLTPDGYTCIVAKLSRFTSAYASMLTAVSRSQLLGGVETLYYEVTCTESDADLLLSIAQTHCRDAAAAIEEAIRTSRSR